jgi:glucose/arabinose dehydrogenase/azurin
MSIYRSIAVAVMLAAALPTEGLAKQDRGEPNRGGDIDLTSVDPKVALARLKPAEGYEVNLFASEREFPELAKPIAIKFDSRGRLWVLTSPTYPHYVPGTPPHDKLIILEDTDADGRADKRTVFADGLYLPMGFELGDGGAYVSQQPDLMHLRDTNGDDRADERRIVLHGFGTEDSHHATHAFTWGPGGDLYFQEGTFLHSQVETPYGPVRVDYAAVFRYVPRTEKLSVFVSYPFANPWGHVVDRWGQDFISDASNGDNYYGTAFSGHVDYPNKQRRMKEWTVTKVRPTCGIEFVRSRHFPDQAQGNFLLTNVIGFHGIKQYRVSDEGSGFVAVEVEPLLQSSDTNFRPVDVQFGPDGALYVADWFNPLIGHMQYSLRDARRDKAHGRIWRVTAKGRPLLERPRIYGQPIEAQLELLKAYEDRTRYTTRLALRAQPTDAVVPALRRWVAGLDTSDQEYEHHLLEALWVYEHHNIVEEDLLKRLLEAKEFRARAAAVRVLQHQFERVNGGMALLQKRVHDPAARVRLEAVRALSFIPTAEAAKLALGALQHPMDYYLQYVLDSTMTTLEKAWKPALTATPPFAADGPEATAYLLARLSPADLARLPGSQAVYRALLSRPDIERQSRQTAIDGLVRMNGTSALREILSAIDRIDGAPGSRETTQDLAQMLSESTPDTLSAIKPNLERLAAEAKNDVVREGALVALMRSANSVEPAWQLASSSMRRRVDVIDATAMLKDQSLLAAQYPKITPLLSSGAGAPTTQSAEGIAGRYVRIVFPGRERTLSLAEVQIFSGGQNIAAKGSASQSSIVAGGAIGGQPDRAIDGRTDGEPDLGSVAFTNLEPDPWWEVDLGSAQTIDTVTIWNRAGEDNRLRLHVSVLDAARKTVFVQDGVPAARPSVTVDVSGDLTGRLRRSAMAALPYIPAHDQETFGLLAAFVQSGPDGAAAVDAIRRVPQSSWPAGQMGPLANSLVAYLREIPPAERTGAAFTQAMELGRQLVGRVPAYEAERITASLDELLTKVVRITAVQAQMKFDVTRFSAAAGQQVEIVFVNADEMPHNVIVTAQGALETVSLKAEAMAATPDGFAKNFVPDTTDVLFATRLIKQNETTRLRFTAPTTPGSYPFVCTFPGHWRTMNGVMEVVRLSSTSSDNRAR